ncbi:MAG: hypothetical protein M0Z66_14660 [Thermaerobacter sp.]|nr:hypothetical protein [Thermaerobacter sp.]
MPTVHGAERHFCGQVPQRMIGSFGTSTHFTGGAETLFNLVRSTRLATVAVAAISLTALLGGCGQQSAAGKASAAAPAVHYHFYMNVVTGGMTGKPGWPQFLPGNFTLPANADVTVTVTSFDDGAAPVPAVYGKVSGTVGNAETVNGQSVSTVDPQQVAHTFTVSGLKLNVPIPVAASAQSPSVVTFTFHTPKAGTYTWQCEAPCGSGTAGWGGPMATSGYMTGTMTISNN